jgi:hypothetical protein
MFRVYDELIAHPQCVSYDFKTPRAELIVTGDLVVAYPFTSPVVEAICAGVPSLYFDPTGAYAGSYYYRLGLAVGGYDALSEKIERYVGMSDRQRFDLSRDQLPALDPFCDGKAIERFVAALRAP